MLAVVKQVEEMTAVADSTAICLIMEVCSQCLVRT